MERQANRTGRRRLRDYQRIRAIQQKRKPHVLANYYFNRLLSLMGIHNSLCTSSLQTEQQNDFYANRLHPDQISNFIENYKWFFIKILTLMMKDNHPSIQIAVQTTFEENYLNETVSRTFFFGLSQLRQRKQLEDPNIWLSLSKSQLKIIYLISILLEGIGQIDIFQQIDFRNLPSNSEEAIDFLFEEIVRILLQHTKLLTRHIFHQIVQQWDMSIALVEQELATQPSFIATGFTSEPITPFSEPSVQDLRSLSQAQDQELQKQEIVQQNSEQVGQIQVIGLNEEDPHRMHGENIIQRDHSEMLNNSSEDEILDEQEQQEAQRNIQPQPLNNRIPRRRNRNNLTLRRMKQERAEINFNWKKRYTRCRNQRAIRQRQEQRREQRRNRLPSESADPLDELLDLRNRHHLQAEEQRVNPQPALVEQVNPNIPNPQPIGEPPQRQPYHEITHEKREIDEMINQLMDNDLAIAQSMANHIYHSLPTVMSMAKRVNRKSSIKS